MSYSFMWQKYKLGMTKVFISIYAETKSIFFSGYEHYVHIYLLPLPS